MATEMLIFEQGKKNPSILMQAQQHPFFPLFYTPEPPPPPPLPDLPPEAMPPGPLPPEAMPPDMGMIPPDASIAPLDLPPEEEA